ncbi:MAG: hypothetical protein HY757_08875 [Nitrospirae bacterium]|nr:hypothetical protein [Nitrospirota bacterium]
MKFEPETNHIRAGHFFLAAAALSVLFWLLESAFHFIILHDNFFETLFTSENHEIWMRLIVVSIIFVLTFYAYSFYKTRKTKELLSSVVKNAQEERTRSEAIIAGIGDGIIIQDTGYKIIYQNQIQTEKYGNRDGEYCYKVYEGRDTVCEFCPVEMSFSDGKVHKAERIVSTGNGTMYYELTSSPLRDSTGKIIAAIKVVRDISDRKEIEAALINYQTHLEALVQDRTSELRASNELLLEEINDRRSLEKLLIDIEEQERRSIGHDLHDGVGQLLTGIAFKVRGLGRKLEQGDFEGADEVADLSVLIDEAKEQISYLSRGLAPVDIDEQGLMMALTAISYYIKKTFGIPCYVMCKEPVMVNNETAVTQLYRIAQEAVTNASKHAKPNRVDISLGKEHDKIILTVKDDGTGLPEDIYNRSGMGLKIMKYRAGIINASLDIRRDIGGGTIVTCIYSDVYEKKDQLSY